MNMCYAAGLLFCLFAQAIVADDDAEMAGYHLIATVTPDHGGRVISFVQTASGVNQAGAGGLIDEGFGTPSRYVPSRRMEEKLELIEGGAGRAAARYTYACEGPNISGLNVRRTMELAPDEASLRVTWEITNGGTERHWIAPWVRNHLAPGGTAGADDIVNLAAFEGVVRADRSRFYAAARNWFAAIDGTTKQTVYGVFDADTTHAFCVLRDDADQRMGVQTSFVPRVLAPGETWKTVYRINTITGLSHIDFATDELAMQLDYGDGKLIALLAAVKPMSDLRIHARVRNAEGTIWKLPTKKFDIAPGKLIRATYAWEAPGDGVYDFLAEIQYGGEQVPFGKDTHSPHGGIDTQFVVGSRGAQAMEAWTDAPHALDRRGRTLERALLASDPPLWQESPMNKLFRDDAIKAKGTAAELRVALARNERESFQIALRPKVALRNLRFHWEAFLREGGGTIEPELLRAYEVAYVPIRVPSHYEGPTGDWPDPLLPHTAAHVAAGQTQPFWFTLHVPENTVAGEYRGEITVEAEGMVPQRLPLRITVYDFTLPATPLFKTDFGFDEAAAARAAKNTDKSQWARAYLEDALAHRVTLRELTAFPANPANAAAHGARLRELLRQGATTFAVPPAYLGNTAAMMAVNALAREKDLAGRLFVPLSEEPEKPAWNRLLDEIAQWKAAAPELPVMVTSQGLAPFIGPALDRWALHTQVFDTTNARDILQAISGGREVWCYVNQTPGRPYANFLIDFAGIEHRILFWQAWALGIKGMHYWSANYVEPGQDPFTLPTDITPVNGDGLLVYPGATGPIASIRWECIRDGIEDYEYLALLAALRREAEARGVAATALSQAQAALNLGELVPSLVGFPRNPALLEAKRDEIAQALASFTR
jgi:hypothetical protein